MRLKISDNEEESVALHDFLIHSTLPLLGKDKGQTCIIGTGTLFKIANRHFIVTAAHTMDCFDLASWSYPANPFQGAIHLIGPATYRRIEGENVDIAVIELEYPETIVRLEKEWRFLTLDSIWLPDYSADSVIVAGYPSIRAKFDGKGLRARIFVLKSNFHRTPPPEAFRSDDPVTEGVDFFVRHKDAINEMTGENVSTETLQGMSGCSIWAFRQRGWVSHRFWSPEAVFRIVGIQSACFPNNYIRGKGWAAALRIMAGTDQTLRDEVSRTISGIASKLFPPV